MTKSILALLTDGFGSRGGIARYNSDFMTALAASPAVGEVVAVPRFGSPLAGVPPGIEQLPALPGRLAWNAKALSLAMSRHFDVIFCGHVHAAPLAAVVARLTGRPMWLQVHGIEAWFNRGNALRWAAERATLITAVSRYTRRRLLEWVDIDQARVRVLPNTVTSKLGRRARRADLVARHGLAGAKVILTVGRLNADEAYKGHDRIIRALPRIAAQHLDTFYLVVGSGDDQARLEALSGQCGVADRVRFAGEVAADDLPDYFALGDVFAMPSTGEGFGIVFLEAARCGMPVIGGNRDGSVDALAEGRIGTAIDPDDEGQLVEAILATFDGRLASDAQSVDRFAFTHFAQHVDDLVRRIELSSNSMVSREREVWCRRRRGTR